MTCCYAKVLITLRLDLTNLHPLAMAHLCVVAAYSVTRRRRLRA
jgi:hypothetical protein